jgi:hypothetical protein
MADYDKDRAVSRVPVWCDGQWTDELVAKLKPGTKFSYIEGMDACNRRVYAVVESVRQDPWGNWNVYMQGGGIIPITWVNPSYAGNYIPLKLSLPASRKEPSITEGAVVDAALGAAVAVVTGASVAKGAAIGAGAAVTVNVAKKLAKESGVDSVINDTVNVFKDSFRAFKFW